MKAALRRMLFRMQIPFERYYLDSLNIFAEN